MAEIRDVMSINSIWVPPETTLLEAAHIMREKDIGFLPVGEDDRLVGVVTDRDMTVRAVAQGYHPQSDTVRAIMTPAVYYCYDDQSVAEVCDSMATAKVRRMPVVNRDKRLVGVVSIGDLAQVCGKGQIGETVTKITFNGTRFMEEVRAANTKAA